MKSEQVWKIFEETASGDRDRAASLAADFAHHGYWRMTPSAALKLSDRAVAGFYRGLKPRRTELGTDSSWMLSKDFAFVNIRACSPDASRSGHVTDALKILPTMRVSSIHLAPFFDCCMDNLYAVDSVRMVSDAVLDPRLSEAGMDGDDQIRLLVDGIHRLGWTVGFDLEPHTSNFSRVALEHPHCFRWLRFNETRSGLFGGLTEEEMLTSEVQEQLAWEVNERVKATLKQHGLDYVEDLRKGPKAVRDWHQDVTHQLIANGYWTLPSHTWGGVGLPAFDYYKHEENYPEYVYQTAEGNDHREHAFGMLSPFRLYDNLPLNQLPDANDPPRLHMPAIELLAGIFPSVQERYGFDFVRLDYVDHVFDSTLSESWEVPTSDRLTPQVLQMVLAAARVRMPHTGAMAERMGVDADDYGSLGFNLLLGTDMLSPISTGYVDFVCRLQRELDGTEEPQILAQSGTARDHRGQGVSCSILAALDSHDSGHPLFWTRPLPEVVGADGIALRHFLARFATCGPRRRPKYEVMGNQDMSTGLYNANNKPVSLQWKNDRAFNQRYHMLEDVYDRYRPFVAGARMGSCEVDPKGQWAAWFLEGDKERLLCVAALEPDLPVEKWLEKPPTLKAVASVRVKVGPDVAVEQVPLDGGDAAPDLTLKSGVLTVKQLPPRGCRLYSIKPKG